MLRLRHLEDFFSNEMSSVKSEEEKDYLFSLYEKLKKNFPSKESDTEILCVLHAQERVFNLVLEKYIHNKFCETFFILEVLETGKPDIRFKLRNLYPIDENVFLSDGDFLFDDDGCDGLLLQIHAIYQNSKPEDTILEIFGPDFTKIGGFSIKNPFPIQEGDPTTYYLRYNDPSLFRS